MQARSGEGIMVAKIIAIENTKGGVGKSTITTNLACQLTAEGYEVLIVDRDPLRISRRWRELSEKDDHPIVVGIDTPTIHRDIGKVIDKFDYILIDGAAVVEEMAASAIRAADLVIVPIHPSGVDMWGAEPVLDLVKTRQAVTDGKPICRVLINGQKKRTKLAKSIHECVDSYGVEILKARISDSVVWPECLMKGLGVMDVKSSAADLLKKELVDLVAELKEIFA